MAIAETWLNNKMANLLFTSLLSYYNVYRADRNSKSSGSSILIHISSTVSNYIAVCIESVELYGLTLSCLNILR